MLIFGVDSIFEARLNKGFVVFEIVDLLRSPLIIFFFTQKAFKNINHNKSLMQKLMLSIKKIIIYSPFQAGSAGVRPAAAAKGGKNRSFCGFLVCRCGQAVCPGIFVQWRQEI